jgi:hypothetical protein
MGAFTKFLEKYVCVQDVVYWANPVDDGQGGYTWDDPVDIKCRWDDDAKVFTDNQGNELVSQAVVAVLQEVDINGMLCLGTIDSLVEAGYLTGDLTKATFVPGAYQIKRVAKVPMLASTTEFYRQVYLSASSVMR